MRFWFILVFSALGAAQNVRVLDDVFPTDRLTTADPQQITGVRMALPLPDCTAQATACAGTAVLNQFDGFALQPRLQVRFSGPVIPETLRAGIRIMFLEKLRNNDYGLGPAGPDHPHQ